MPSRIYNPLPQSHRLHWYCNIINDYVLHHRPLVIRYVEYIYIILQTNFELAKPIRLSHVTLFGCRVGGDEGDLSFGVCANALV
jgi:hypothetical protein